MNFDQLKQLLSLQVSTSHPAEPSTFSGNAYAMGLAGAQLWGFHTIKGMQSFCHFLAQPPAKGRTAGSAGSAQPWLCLAKLKDL